MTASSDQYVNSRFCALFLFFILCLQAEAKGTPNQNLTACQHLRRLESRRAKVLVASSGRIVHVPRCNKEGAFEPIQCMNEKKGLDCWCVDEYGFEIPGTRNGTKSSVNCAEPEGCSEAVCRMFCPAGFRRDEQTQCSICRCRDPCENFECPNGQLCQLQEVICKDDACPPLPTCRNARSLTNYCPAGLPLVIEGSIRPFLCGNEAGKPQCPPLYRCMIESGNDYGVCCPSALRIQKPGICPDPEKSTYTESTGYLCGSPCTHDLECENLQKCCFTKSCHFNCQQPLNITTCQQARVLTDLLAINEREGRGYIPDCNGPDGMFSPKQCSRNGLVCWCVDPRTGHKIKGTMGSAASINCDNWENMINSRSMGRSLHKDQCDTNICAAVCEYGFKNDHRGCPTCECAEPCEGYKCPPGSHCEVATDPLCESGSILCASWPICKPDFVYSNPCDVGSPLMDNNTGVVMYCMTERHSREFRVTAFFEDEPDLKEGRSLNNFISCPNGHKCTKLHGEAQSVCCPSPTSTKTVDPSQKRQQTMCEYLRDFSERMEGTESGMKLAISVPRCTQTGHYHERQCAMKTIWVPRNEQRKILEENTVRKMRTLLNGVSPKSRPKRDLEPLKLYRVGDEMLKVQVGAPTMSRSAKLIDKGAEKLQGLGQLFETNFKKILPTPKNQIMNSNDLVEMEVEECWCVDNFGTEIPRSRSSNITDEYCVNLRNEIGCLDLTCRMGCEYGFSLDLDSRCPKCQCRDPCEGISCPNDKECRVVDVSCDEEYCPPVPACLPRKPGQCPYLVPPGPDNFDRNICAYECRTDSHCEGSKRCCSNGCGTQCVEPQLKTACQHLRAIQLHQSSELGIPAMKMHIARCDITTGKWNELQCSPPTGQCWCVDEKGWEINGSRVNGTSPVCTVNSAFQCSKQICQKSCESGYKVDANGCATCECRNFCDEISCSADEECQLINVECIDNPCPKMPICVPLRDSACPQGNPLKIGNLELSCGPHNENEVCPTTHTCQLNPVSHRGVCCSKTRDVCFESMDSVCLSKGEFSKKTATRYRFNPKVNKCTPITIDLDTGMCQTKNLFQNEQACRSVCPVLTQCERLKLKNRLAAQRSNQPSVWFQPRCDPITGHWSPVQCLSKQNQFPAYSSSNSEKRHQLSGSNRADITNISSPHDVCWCSDRKGAPIKGSLTRDMEPVCNRRQARGKGHFGNDIDLVMENLIRHITLLVDMDNSLHDDLYLENHEEYDDLNDSMAVENSPIIITPSAPAVSVTEHVLELANSLHSQQSIKPNLKPLTVLTTRCRSIARTAQFPVSCDEKGSFLPTQCNGNVCWCVNSAGNQLDATHTFRRGTKICEPTPITSVTIELYLQNQAKTKVQNKGIYDTIRSELQQLLGEVLENLRIQENLDGSVIVRFELHNNENIDMAYAIETAINEHRIQLDGGRLRPDITRSHFIHHAIPRYDLQLTEALVANTPQNTMQLAVFVMATGSAFLISVFVVYVMLKRGKEKVMPSYDHAKYPQSRKFCCNDNKLEYTSPIFILSSSTNKRHDSGVKSNDSTDTPNILPETQQH